MFLNFPKAKTVTLFGEGYGGKIQMPAGKKYREEPTFILFDAIIDGWWLEHDKLTILAKQMKVADVPFLGVLTLEQIEKLVKSKPTSQVAEDKTLLSEGIVARSHPQMLFRDKNPIMFKLKRKDYKNLEGGKKNE